jgi:prepilin-type processing-associated H-X9-DG protein
MICGFEGEVLLVRDSLLFGAENSRGASGLEQTLRLWVDRGGMNVLFVDANVPVAGQVVAEPAHNA